VEVWYSTTVSAWLLAASIQLASNEASVGLEMPTVPFELSVSSLPLLAARWTAAAHSAAAEYGLTGLNFICLLRMYMVASVDLLGELADRKRTLSHQSWLMLDLLPQFKILLSFHLALQPPGFNAKPMGVDPHVGLVDATIKESEEEVADPDFACPPWLKPTWILGHLRHD